MGVITSKVAGCIPPLPPGIDCPYSIGQKILAVNATYIFPVVGIFPDCYELVMIHTGFPTMKIEDKEYQPWTHSVAMINPGQAHAAKQAGPSRLYNPFFIDSELINTVARAMGGKGQVLFKNCICDLPGELLTLARMFFQETNSELPSTEMVVSSLETMLAVTLLRSLPNNQNLHYNTPVMDRHSVERVKEFMHQHYQQSISLEQLARVANYSTYHFIRFFKNATGRTPYEYFMDIKIEKAAEMLHNKSLSVTEVCYTCGFTNPSHFSTVFKRKKGITPSRYQKHS